MPHCPQRLLRRGIEIAADVFALNERRAGAVAGLTTGLGIKSVGRTAVQFTLLMALVISAGVGPRADVW